MFSYELDILESDNQFFLSYKNNVIKTAQGNHPVKHDSFELIEFIKNDFERCGEISVKKDFSIDFNMKFCAYAIFSDQKNFIENEKHEKYHKNISNLFIKYDMCFIRTGNGPPYELEQHARLELVLNKLIEIVGKETFGKLSKYAWGNYLNSMSEGDETEDAANISDENFISLKLTTKIEEIFNNFSNEEKGAVYGLYSMLNSESIILPILIISKHISISEYTNAYIGLGNNFVYVYEDAKDKNESNKRYQEMYDLGFGPATIAIEYTKVSNLNKINNPENEIRELINTKENDKIEFKQTFNLDIKTYTVRKELEFGCFKTIAGFLNTKGGDLLIGVSDNSEILGIDEEVNKFHKGSTDIFLQFVANKIQSIFGKEIYLLLKWNIFKIQNKNLLRIQCKPSDKEVYIKDEFYVRSNPRTDKLEGKALVEYIKKRFK